ncbi:uncharacterized protein PAC_08039 [Phialocephala subalpina]|uniref:Calcineurin-like phosphoesterase domain-containing protein n=1 Tax=Phialocephala subalpina TaxID=576137 RepID=A0A1L7WZE9_9HELO|nr:uncharacterized protein PAC_08039 [Phialocephala subalpina]
MATSCTFQVAPDLHLERRTGEYTKQMITKRASYLLPGDTGSVNQKQSRYSVLEKDSYDMELDGYKITILGCTMWSDIRLTDNKGASDGGLILGNGQVSHRRRFVESVAWIRGKVQKVRIEKPDHKILIMTHHAPTIRGSGPYGLDQAGERWSTPRSNI